MMRTWILLTLAFLSTMVMFWIPETHATQTIVGSLSPVPGTTTMVCQMIPYNTGFSSQPSGLENYCVGLTGQVWKDNDETDPNHDYFGAFLEVNAINGTNANGPPYAWATSIYPLNGYSIQFPSSAGNQGYDPPTQTTTAQTSITLTFSFISLNLLLPAQSTSATQNYGSTTFSYNWQVTESSTGAATGTSVFGSKADFGAIVSVPEGASFTVGFGAHVTITSDCYFGGGPCNGFFGTNNTPFDVSGSIFAPDPDFSLSGPSSVSIAPCSTTTTTITATSQPTFQGTVYFSDSAPLGITTSFSPTSVWIGGGGGATTTYSITWPCNASGTYSWSVKAYTTAGTNLQHSWFITNSPDFSISANPTGLTLSGSSDCGTSRITVQSLGYAGTVYLSVSSVVYVQLRQSSATSPLVSSMTLSNSGSGSATLYVWANSGTSGTFPVNVTAYTGVGGPGLSHSTVVSVTFTNYTNVCGSSGGGGGGGGKKL